MALDDQISRFSVLNVLFIVLQKAPKAKKAKPAENGNTKVEVLSKDKILFLLNVPINRLFSPHYF